ncbi:MAG TPA: AAA family ATPase, partial [Mycobacteriales bacterium]|nr:AAA family ATPase [Mycobacteriales bacterium]
MAVAAGPTRLVGRDAEVALLRADLEATVHGHGAAVFVVGESGVGKTRLLGELASLARERDIPVLSGVAMDVGDGVPFWPVRDALRGFLRNPGNRWALDVVAPWAAGLAALVPAIPSFAADPGVREHRDQSSLDLLVQVVIALLARGPLLVLLDDMHLSDQSSRSLLTYLLAVVADQPLMLVVAYRDDIANGGQGIQELAVELQRSRRATVVPLRPLDRAAVCALVTVDDRELVDFVWERSAGNPFLVEEIVGFYRDRGALGIPDTLRELVRARVRLLPEPVPAVLRALAVGDEPVSHQVLAEVTELAEPDLLLAVRTAVAAGAVRVDDNGDGYRLRHGIMRDVLDADLLPGERLRLHRRHAEALERLAEPDLRTAASLARHWDRAEDWPRSLSASLVAADDAVRAYGFAEAQEHLLRALSRSDRVGITAERRATLQERAARAAHLAGDHERACALLRQRLAALTPGPDTTSARLYGELGRYLSAAGLLRDAVEAHARAVALLPDDAAPDVRAAVLAGHAEALADAGRYGESHAQAQAAAAIAEGAGLSALRARILPTLGCSLANLGRASEGLTALWEGLRLAASAGLPEDIARAHVGVCNLLCGPLNNLEEGIAAGRRAVEEVATLGLARTFGVQLQAIVANALFRIGEWSAAGALVEQALAATPTGAAAIELRLARCRLLVGCGDLRTAEDELDVLTTLCDQTVGP